MHSYKKLTEKESIDLSNYQLTSLGIGIAKGQFKLSDVGDLLPGSVMLHDMRTLKATYMNKWGCDHLRHSLEEIEAMGGAYYDKFFFEEEMKVTRARANEFVGRKDPTSQFAYYERLKIEGKNTAGLYYSSCKLLSTEDPLEASDKLIIISTPVQGVALAGRKLSKLVEENEYAMKNHNKFVSLTQREKQIISLLAEGKSSQEISEVLFISYHTVTTHRKNISRKLNIRTFSELLKFANAFDLIRY